MKKATTPISTFCAALITTACDLAVRAMSPAAAGSGAASAIHSVASSLAATTPDVVSIVPPSHAPATSCSVCGSSKSSGRIVRASHGMR